MMFHVSRLFLFFSFPFTPHGSHRFCPVFACCCWGLFAFAIWVRCSPFVVHHSHVSFTVRIRRSSFYHHLLHFPFLHHLRSFLHWSWSPLFTFVFRTSIAARSCFAPPLLSRSGNITILLLFVGFVAFVMFDVPLFPIFAWLGCFCKDFKVGYSLPITLTFISQPCTSCNLLNAYWLKVSAGSEKNQ